jgi:hypothetical protein
MLRRLLCRLFGHPGFRRTVTGNNTFAWSFTPVLGNRPRCVRCGALQRD